MSKATRSEPNVGIMGGRCRAAAYLVLLGFSCGTLAAQTTETFAYTGDDVLRDAMNVHRTNYGGLANNFALQEQTIVLPYLPSLFYEAGYLIQPSNRNLNMSVCVVPELFLSAFFMGRVSGFAELALLDEATNKQVRGIGFRAGVGYSVLGSTFDLTESGPVVRAGILIRNIRATYAYSVGQGTIIDHQFGIGIKFDW